MRQRFEQQMRLSTLAIGDVKFPLKSHDELPPVLKALQYIFITPDLNERIFTLLKEKICKDKKKTGRKGMDLWHIFVLAVVRHTLDTNVHFPTDLNLPRDSMRKCFDVVEGLKDQLGLKGWRKIKHLKNGFKSQFRKMSHQVFKGKKETLKKQSVKQYLNQAYDLSNRFKSVINDLSLNIIDQEIILDLRMELDYYNKFVKKFTDQIERRLLKGKIIPTEEKIFSIFEQHTE